MLLLLGRSGGATDRLEASGTGVQNVNIRGLKSTHIDSGLSADFDILNTRPFQNGRNTYPTILSFRIPHQ